MPSDPTMVEVRLRDVDVDDLDSFYRNQMDPDAVAMAAVPARDRDAFMAHWGTILTKPAGEVQTILVGDRCVGYVVTWEQSGMHLVGYWVDRRVWGRGIATQALALFVTRTKARPLHAYVAAHNSGSIRVLEKVGFQNVDGPDAEPVVGVDGVAEFLLVLAEQQPRSGNAPG